MQPLKPIDPTLLVNVIGGVSKMTRKVNDPTVLNAVTQLKSDLDSLVTTAKNSQSNSSPMTAMLPMLMMNRG